MPIFEYSCQSCAHKFEELVLSSSATVSCPKCSSNSSIKQLSVFSSPGSEPQTGFSRRMRLHAADLRLPLSLGRYARRQVLFERGPDPLERFTDVRKNFLLDELPAHPEIEGRAVGEVDIRHNVPRSAPR